MSARPAPRCCRCDCSPTAASPPGWSPRAPSRVRWPGSRWCSPSTSRPGSGGRRVHAGLTLLPFSLGAFVGTGDLGAARDEARQGRDGGRRAAAVGRDRVGVWPSCTPRATPCRRGTSPRRWCVSGVGLGLLVVPLVDVALATIPTTEAGAASGTYGTVQQVGAALGRRDHRHGVLRRRRHVVRRGTRCGPGWSPPAGWRRRLRARRGRQPAAPLARAGARPPRGRSSMSSPRTRSPSEGVDGA